MPDILVTESWYDDCTDTKDLIEKQLVYQHKPISTKWMFIFRKLEIDPTSLKPAVARK